MFASYCTRMARYIHGNRALHVWASGSSYMQLLCCPWTCWVCLNVLSHVCERLSDSQWPRFTACQRTHHSLCVWEQCALKRAHPENRTMLFIIHTHSSLSIAVPLRFVLHVPSLKCLILHLWTRDQLEIGQCVNSTQKCCKNIMLLTALT